MNKKHYSLPRTFTLLNEDFDRYLEGNRNPVVIIFKFFHNSGMIFSLFFRLQQYFQYHNWLLLRIIGYTSYPFYFFVTYYVLSYHIEPDVQVDGGLLLHNKSIVIANCVIIGKNASIMGDVTIGTGFVPNHFKIQIGNNIRIGSGAKIITKGRLDIVDNVTIGANAVVVKSILKSGVYAGVPVKRISK